MVFIKDMDSIKEAIYQLEAIAHDTSSDWAESVFDSDLGYCKTFYSEVLDTEVYEVWHFDELLARIRECAKEDCNMSYYVTPILPAGPKEKMQ